jgi:hypothetical protein
MSPRVVRRVVIAVCVAGIAGMIVSSIADNTGAALTAGLVTAIAVLCLIVATAVTGAQGVGVTDLLADDVEERVESLVANGADEVAVRALVGAAVKLGRSHP